MFNPLCPTHIKSNHQKDRRNGWGKWASALVYWKVIIFRHSSKFWKSKKNIYFREKNFFFKDILEQ